MPSSHAHELPEDGERSNPSRSRRIADACLPHRCDRSRSSLRDGSQFDSEEMADWMMQNRSGLTRIDATNVARCSDELELIL